MTKNAMCLAAALLAVACGETPAPGPTEPETQPRYLLHTAVRDLLA